MKLKSLFPLFAIVLFSIPLQADEYTGSGVVVSNHNGEWGGGFNLEAGVTATGTEGFNGNGYGHGHFDLTFGVPFGLNASGNYGYQVSNSESPIHLGVEPFNLDFKFTTTREDEYGNNKTENFIEWLPAVSAGFLIPGNTCRVLALARGGYDFSTKGSGPLTGGAIYANCNDLDVAGEFTRVFKNDGGERDTVVVDATVPIRLFRSKHSSLGLRVEHISDNDIKLADGGLESRQETRGFITGRLAF